MLPRSAPIRVLALAGLMVVTARATSPPVEPGPWELAQRLDFNAAHAAFVATPAPADRATRLGLAATLLNRQPKTTANRDHAAGQLEALLAEAGDDAPAFAARYLLGRIALVHTSPADPSTARHHFAALATRGNDHPFVQLAAGQLLLLDLADATLPSAERLEHGEALALPFPPGPLPAALHMILAQFCLDENLDAGRALAHLRTALEYGLATATARADALVSAAFLAARTAPDDARAWRETFLAEFPRDPRAPTIRAALADSSPRPAAPSP
jgi:hypothetical protein